MSKHFKFRSLMSIIYALIMLLPVTSVAFRCAYTIFNKNAYESYYGETINEQQIEYIRNMDSFVAGYEYYFSNTAQFPSTSTSYVDKLYVTNLYVPNTDVSQVSYITFYSDNQIHLYFRNAGGTTLFSKDATNPDIANISFTFNYFNVVNTQSMNDTLDCLLVRRITYNKYSYLDNAFEYSLYEFIGNNGRGVLNLTDWFTSVFLQSSTHTQLYLDFINWYMNYTLLVSCVYILYLVLMWFVSLARRLLTNMIEKGGELK